MTLTAGIYPDLCIEEYFADPCPEPSLTQSGIKRLLTGSPAEFAAYHPKLTKWPELADETTKAKDLGAAVHSAVLGRGREVMPCDPEDCPARTDKGKPYSNWSGDAKVWKLAREAEGLIVLSKKNGDAACVTSAAQSMTDMLRREYGDWPIGDSEVTIIWQRETAHGPIWCRALLDHLALRHMTVLDPKSTDWPINNRMVKKNVTGGLWGIQAAFYIEAVQSVYPETMGRLRFRFPLAEINPPYQKRFITMGEARIGISRQRIDRAADLFAKCLRANEWPEYEQDYEPELESWEIAEFEAEEMQ